MTEVLPLAAFRLLAPVPRTTLVEGLATAIDAVAARGPAAHAFLRHAWYAAALTPGARARTVVVEEDGVAVLALPFVGAGAPGLASVPGSYWPFRGVPAALEATPAAWPAALAQLARAARAVRVGPVAADDRGAAALLAAARQAGWTVLERQVADGWVLDLAALAAAGAWPRGSTLRKNRFHERHLAAHGALEWRFLEAGDWPAGFDLLASVEERGWVTHATDGRDAKFTAAGHGALWRRAAADPVLAAMMSAAVLLIDGIPAAFSFDLDAGYTRYAIANSYDPRFARHSPGKLLHYRNLARALDRGIARVDWGMGDSGYKQVLGAGQGAPMVDRVLVRPGVAAGIARLAAATSAAVGGTWRPAG